MTILNTNRQYKHFGKTWMDFLCDIEREILTDNTIFLDKKDGKYGFVDKNGVVVANYIYEDATEQNTIYTVCSEFVFNVFYEAFENEDGSKVVMGSRDFIKQIDAMINSGETNNNEIIKTGTDQ